MLEIETSLGPSRKLLEVRALAANSSIEESDYTIFISRARDGRLVTFEASNEALLSPGDVVEVKLKRRNSGQLPSIQNQAAQDVDPASYVTGATATK